MSDKDPNWKPEKDFTTISVGFRIPKYLANFVKNFESQDKGLTKSDIFRLILDLLYDQPWLLEDYIDGKQITNSELFKFSKKSDETNKEIKELKAQITNLAETVSNIEKKLIISDVVIEKLLGVSFAQIQNIPKPALEQIYANYLESNS